MRRSILGGIVLLAGMAGVLVYHGIAQDREFQRLIAEGDRARAAGNAAVAIEAYSGALTLNSDSMAVYLKRGETYQARGDLQTARRDLLMATQLEPAATRARERLGDVSMALKDYDEAAAHYQAFVELDDQNPHLLYKLALALQRSGRVARAVITLRRTIALSEPFAEAHYALGLCLHEQGRLEEARVALERATELSPGFLQARESLAAVHRARGNRGGELQQLDALAALDGNSPERHAARALGYTRAGRTAMAILALSEAAERHGDRPEIRSALGRVWLEIAERDDDWDALANALEALQSVPPGSATSETLALLGRAWQLSGNTEEARRILRLAVSRYPIAPSALLHLAALEAKARDTESARLLRRRHRALTQDAGHTSSPIG